MPRNEACPKYLIESEFDATVWSSTGVVTRGGSTTSLESGLGIAMDTTAFLNGHGCSETLGGSLQRVSTAAGGAAYGAWTVGIDTDDRVYIENDTIAFSVRAAPGNTQIGFPVGSPTGSINTGGTIWRATAPSDWIRGTFIAEALSIAVPPPGYGTLLVPGYAGQVQDVPIYLRFYTSADLDGQSDENTIQWAEGDEHGVNTIHWGRNDEGHCFVSYPAAVADISAWPDTDFRDRLGFTGDETPVGVLSNNFYVLTAEYPMPGVLAPYRPFNSVLFNTEDVTPAVDQTDGGYSTNYVATFHNWLFSGYLDGPTDFYGPPGRDNHQHWGRRCLPYLGTGRRVAVYQDVGDSRRASEREDYGLLYTHEMDGYRGRVVGRMNLGNVTSYTVTWNNAGNLRMRAPLSFTVRETLL